MPRFQYFLGIKVDFFCKHRGDPKRRLEVSRTWYVVARDEKVGYKKQFSRE